MIGKFCVAVAPLRTRDPADVVADFIYGPERVLGDGADVVLTRMNESWSEALSNGRDELYVAIVDGRLWISDFIDGPDCFFEDAPTLPHDWWAFYCYDVVGAYGFAKHGPCGPERIRLGVDEDVYVDRGAFDKAERAMLAALIEPELLPQATAVWTGAAPIDAFPEDEADDIADALEGAEIVLELMARWTGLRLDAEGEPRNRFSDVDVYRVDFAEVA